jgi:hypothetical protein
MESCSICRVPEFGVQSMPALAAPAQAIQAQVREYRVEESSSSIEQKDMATVGINPDDVPRRRRLRTQEHHTMQRRRRHSNTWETSGNELIAEEKKERKLVQLYWAEHTPYI